MTGTEARLAAAVERHRAGAPGEAAVVYSALLAEDPLHADALHLLGLTRRASGDQGGAAALIRLSLAVRPAFADAYGNLVNALAAAGRWTEALAAARHVLVLQPGRPGASETLVALAMAAGERAAADGDGVTARRLFTEAHALAPGRADVAERLMRALAEVDLLAAILLAERLWLADPGRGEHRENLWNLACKAGPDAGSAACAAALAKRMTPATLVALGNALRYEGHGRRAELAYQCSAALHPDQPFAYARLACLHVQHRRLASADTLFRRVAERWGGREEVMRFDPGFIAAALATAPPPALPGDGTPAAGWIDSDRGVLVFSACDGRYFDLFASALVHSTVRNAGLDAFFHLHVVNPPADLAGRIAGWDARLGSPGIGWSSERVDAAALGAEAKTVYACSRFRLLPAVLRRYRRPLLLLDTDLIVLRALAPLMAAAGEGDIALVGGEHHRFEPWNTFWADVIVIRPTAAAMAFFDRVAAYIGHFLDHGKPRWFLDQIALTAVAACGADDGPAPRLVLLPKDIHRLALSLGPEGEDRPPSGCLFWSAHASTVSTRFTRATPYYAQYLL